MPHTQQEGKAAVYPSIYGQSSPHCTYHQARLLEQEEVVDVLIGHLVVVLGAVDAEVRPVQVDLVPAPASPKFRIRIQRGGKFKLSTEFWVFNDVVIMFR